MRRCFFCFLKIVTIVFLAAGSALGAAVEEGGPDLAVDYLLERGVDVAGAGPLQCAGTICYAAQDDAVLLCFAGGRGLFVKLDDVREAGLLVRFDTEKESVVSLQVNPDCVKEISEAVQAVLSAAHNCAYNIRPFKCAEDLLDFVTRLYLVMVECGSSG